jgi:protein-S-isoprenylcysteine O-methyltransferase Ste14
MQDPAPFPRRLLRQWESPPTWLVLFLLLAWAQARFAPLLPTGAALGGLGLALILVGLVIFALALAQFRRHRTTVLPREVPQAMIRDGIYRLTRNPIYLADALILTGAILRWDAASLLLVPVFMAVIQRRFIHGEEAGLRTTFGADFEPYAAQVRRWL